LVRGIQRLRLPVFRGGLQATLPKQRNASTFDLASALITDFNTVTRLMHSKCVG
jgi:hypothetical protein